MGNGAAGIIEIDVNRRQQPVGFQIIGMAFHQRFESFLGETFFLQAHEALGRQHRSFLANRPVVLNFGELGQAHAKGIQGRRGNERGLLILNREHPNNSSSIHGLLSQPRAARDHLAGLLRLLERRRGRRLVQGRFAGIHQTLAVQQIGGLSLPFLFQELLNPFHFLEIPLLQRGVPFGHKRGRAVRVSLVAKKDRGDGENQHDHQKNFQKKERRHGQFFLGDGLTPTRDAD